MCVCVWYIPYLMCAFVCIMMLLIHTLLYKHFTLYNKRHTHTHYTLNTTHTHHYKCVIHTTACVFDFFSTSTPTFRFFFRTTPETLGFTDILSIAGAQASAILYLYLLEARTFQKFQNKPNWSPHILTTETTNPDESCLKAPLGVAIDRPTSASPTNIV
jgi:hypothetical protein